MASLKDTVDRRRTPLADYPETISITKYKEIMMDMLHIAFPLLTEDELALGLDHYISKNFKDFDLKIDNNYKNKQVEMTMQSLVQYILSKEPIITTHGTLFARHGSMPNPIYDMIEEFISLRKVHKGEMFKYPKGSELFERFNLLQLLDKIDANGFYGTTAQHSCIFYNIYVASSTTSQGRSCNSAAALFFESFLNNNVPFGSMNELVEFIYNVLHEDHIYDSNMIITNHASLEETFFQVMSTTGFGWIPTEQEMKIIWDMLSKFNQDELDRLFYKNNLYNFIDNPEITKALLYILQSLSAPFMDPNNPPDEIKESLEALYDVLAEYVYYDKQIIDRLDKMATLIRTVSIVQDTDSAIISLDGWYRYVCRMCIGVPMTIKKVDTDLPAYIDEEIKTEPANVPAIEDRLDDDDLILEQRFIRPMKIVPQDGLRYSIINIMTYIISKLVNDYMAKYCANSNSENDRPCLITMKNEFLNKIGLYSGDALQNPL